MAADETRPGTEAQARSVAPLLRCTEVGKSYLDGSQEIWAVRGASLALAPGEIGLLLGPSGSGKSTLLALASGLARPTEGEVELAGLRLSRLPERLRTEHRRRHVGLVFQQLQLLERERVLDNVVLPLLPWGVPAAEAERRALRLLAELGLAGLVRSRAGRLSGGEMQRVALARALVIDPPLLLLDEPTSHLDAANAEILLEELERLRGQGRAILVATHDPRVVERLRVDQLFQMADGGLRRPGTSG